MTRYAIHGAALIPSSDVWPPTCTCGHDAADHDVREQAMGAAWRCFACHCDDYTPLGDHR